MQRNKKILLISHCLFNVNSKVGKLANYEGCLEDLIVPLIQRGYGFIQLPCPELLYGLRRWGQVKDQYDTPYYRKHIQKLLEPILDQLIDYKNNDYEICGCIGVDGSPSCGVNFTCRGDNWQGEVGAIDTMDALQDVLTSLKKVSEKGVLMEEFDSLLNHEKINLNYFAIDEMNPDASIQNILKELK